MVFDTLIGMVGFFTLMFFLNAVANIFRPEPAVTPAIILFLCVTLLLVLWRIRRAKFFATASTTPPNDATTPEPGSVETPSIPGQNPADGAAAPSPPSTP